MFRDQASDDAWVRYDLALKYESGTPDFVAEHIVARQRTARTPHMVRVKRLFSIRPNQFVLKFSLDSRQDTAIVMALTRTIPGRQIRGALLTTHKSQVESEQQLSAIGAEILNSTSPQTYDNQLMRTDRLAFMPVEGVGIFELWYDGFVGDWALGHGRITLRISHDGPDKRLLSDGTQE